jgi:hypothetical protein
MAWNQVLCEGSPDCPGRVMLNLTDGQSNLVIYSERDSSLRTFSCSLPALLGVQRGTRTHLASDAGECVLSKEADGIWVTLYPKNFAELRFFVPSDDFLLSLSRLVEAKAVQRRVSLQ